MSILNKVRSRILLGINTLIYRTKWYNETLQFAGCRKIAGLNFFNVDIVNLGSSSSYYAFNYDNTGVKGINLATLRQPLRADKELIKNYFSYIKEGGVVLIPLCLFSSLVGKEVEIDDKYYTLLQNESIPHFSWKKKLQVLDLYMNPYKSFPLWSFPYELLRPLKRRKSTMTAQELELDSKKWIDGWKHEFSIDSFEDSFSLHNYDSYLSSCELLREIIDFCLSRSLKPVVVFPPVSVPLASKITPKMKGIYIQDFVHKGSSKDIPFLNYLMDDMFIDNNLYMNSLFLNRTGSALFTNRIIDDLKAMGYLDK